MPDHYMWGEPFGRGIEQPDSTLDTWVALSYLAAKTNKVKLGTLVTPIPFRHPGILAKMVSTLDLLSSGRTVLGVGAGWSQVEFEGYSEWNDSKTRVDKTEEGVRLILKLWQEKRVDFHGKYYKTNGAILEPKPVQKPHPPLLFGGQGTRMLRLAGRYGDICFIRPSTQLPFDKAKAIVSQEALKVKRQVGPAYAAGSPRFEGTKFDTTPLVQDIERAANTGCEFQGTLSPLDEKRKWACPQLLDNMVRRKKKSSSSSHPCRWQYTSGCQKGLGQPRHILHNPSHAPRGGSLLRPSAHGHRQSPHREHRGGGPWALPSIGPRPGRPR